VAQCFNSSVVLPKYSKTWRLRSSTSPLALKVHTKPRNGIDDLTKAFLTLLERRLVALALDRNRREMRNLLLFGIAFLSC